MLTLFRWHTKQCHYDSRHEKRCTCPIWFDWSMPNGKRLRKSLGLRDWQAAQRRAREMEADGITSSGEAVTILKAIEDFERDVENNIEASTLKQYKILLTRLNAFCQSHGYVFLKQLGVVQVREFRTSWDTWSPRTSGKHIERLKRFFNWCVENGWIQASPAKPLKTPKVGETDVVPFTEEEVEKILQACEAYQGPNKARLIVLTEMMLATGLAIGDASTLSKAKIAKSHAGYSVELRRMKTGSAVSCPIPNDLAKAILALDGDTPFWSGKSDLEDITKNWRKIYARIFKAAGINGHPHQFRHTAAKRLLVKGVSAVFVASVLGDSEEIVRRHYSKWIPERQAAVDKAIRATWKAQSRVKSAIYPADVRQTAKRTSQIPA
jgi:site-specific recombinase XerD